MVGPLLVAFGISLFAISIRFPVPGLQYLTLSVTDVTVTLLLLYAFTWKRRILPTVIIPATLALAGAGLLSGFVNHFTDPAFDDGNFAANFLRMTALVAMVILLPRLTWRMRHDRLAWATLWVIRAHAIIVVADVMVALPIAWGETGAFWSPGAADSPRPAGLFGEPSYFAVYMGLALFYVLQVERNAAIRLLRVYDFVLVSVALVASTAVTAIGVLGLFVLALAARTDVQSRLRVLAGTATALLILTALLMGSRDQGWGRSWDYLVDRLSSLPASFSFETGQFSNDSSVRRLIGGPLFAYESLQDSPWVGVGLGGRNADRALARYVQYDPTRIANLSLTMMPAAVTVTLGIVGLIPWMAILIWVLRSKQSFLLGIGLSAVALMWGGAYNPLFWWYVCLAPSLRAAYGAGGGQPDRIDPLSLRQRES